MKLALGFILEEKEIESFLKDNDMDYSVENSLKVSPMINWALKEFKPMFNILKEIEDVNGKVVFIAVGVDVLPHYNKMLENESYQVYEIDDINNDFKQNVKRICEKLQIDEAHTQRNPKPGQPHCADFFPSPGR